MDTQELLRRAVAVATHLTAETALEGMAEVCGASLVPADLPADVVLSSEGWTPARVCVRGGRVWTRGDERCVVTAADEVRPF